MIIDILIYILAYLINAVCLFLPTWSPFPETLTNGVGYLFDQLSVFNFLIPVDTLFSVIILLIEFEVAYLSAKLIFKVINFFRGTGSGLDL